MPTRKFHEVLADLIDASPLTQTEIAIRLGYDRPNLITMWHFCDTGEVRDEGRLQLGSGHRRTSVT